MMTPKGVETRRKNEIQRYGSLEAYKEVMRARASIGGSQITKNTKLRGFGTHRELAVKHGKMRKRVDFDV